MLLPLWLPLGSGVSVAAVGGIVHPAFVDSQQTRWVHPIRVSNSQTVLVTVEVLSPTITVR